MNTKRLFIAALVLAAALTGFAVLTAERLPADAMLPTHWNAAGEPDSFSPALEALLFPPMLLVGVSLLFLLIPRIEPLQDRLEGSAPVLRASWIGMMGLFTIISAAVGLPAWGVELPVNIIMLGVGLLLVVLGNALPKSRPGFFVGIRTPWAILDTDNWIATHRLGGKLMLLAGIAICIVALLPVSPELTTWVVLGTVLAAAFIPYLYSWWLWEQAKRAHSGTGDRKD